ncbi:MAG: IMP cyclohydrolase [Candidatus Carbobacillus altaicus]|uniref:Bifunctional purine biosynthesis protein PurH n=1 Tax=Candidatus Carbonibacillus altaicus TaxID=2163959 RepID=A0A2R6XYK7_9BACL|nr:MAG: IMP cyclohydrolase [Candidatus Carbobacillus altaicus]
MSQNVSQNTKQSYRAFLSVSDKTGLVSFAQELVKRGFELVASSGTARYLQENGLSVQSADEITGFRELIGGRVKTLHPLLHAAILARQDDAGDMADLQSLGVMPFQLVMVGLYPFEAVAESGADMDTLIENIDIGGVALIRGAAKNARDVCVVTDSGDFKAVLRAWDEGAEAWSRLKQRLQLKAFRTTAYYDALIAETLARRLERLSDQEKGQEATQGREGDAEGRLEQLFPEKIVIPLQRKERLRYGENPHQAAAYYRHPRALTAGGETLVDFMLLQGKPLSYNNIQDAESALMLVKRFREPAAVVIKHMNPCGVAVAESIEAAFQKAFDADPVSIFGGIVALNRPMTGALAQALKDVFLEVIIAPDMAEEARMIFASKKNVRLLVPKTKRAALLQSEADVSAFFELTSMGGGVLLQTPDHVDEEEINTARVVSKRAPTEEEWQALHFAWKVVASVKSNAIVVAKDGQTLGIGAGQMNRVGSVRIALDAAGEKAKGAVLASDAFFPMPDSIELAGMAGISAIVHPGGSIRDEAVIRAADAYDMAMILTGRRHFRH